MPVRASAAEAVTGPEQVILLTPAAISTGLWPSLVRTADPCPTRPLDPASDWSRVTNTFDLSRIMDVRT
jgi:hypothetical protein